MQLVGSIGHAIAASLGRVEVLTICSGPVLTPKWFHDIDPDISMQGHVRFNRGPDRQEALNTSSFDHTVDSLNIRIQSILHNSMVIKEEARIHSQNMRVYTTSAGMAYVKGIMNNRRNGGGGRGSAMLNMYDQSPEILHQYNGNTVYGVNNNPQDFFMEGGKQNPGQIFTIDFKELTLNDGTRFLTQSRPIIYRNCTFFNDGLGVLLSYGRSSVVEPNSENALLESFNLTEAYNILSFIPNSLSTTTAPRNLTGSNWSSMNGGLIRYSPKEKRIAISGYPSSGNPQTNMHIFNVNLNTHGIGTVDWNLPISTVGHGNIMANSEVFNYSPNWFRRFSRNGKYVYLGINEAGSSFDVRFRSVVKLLQIPFNLNSVDSTHSFRKSLCYPYPEKNLTVSDVGIDVPGNRYEVLNGVYHRNRTFLRLPTRNVYPHVPNRLLEFRGELLTEVRTLTAESNHNSPKLDMVMTGGTLSKLVDTPGTMTHFVAEFYGPSGTSYAIGTIGLIGSGADMEFPNLNLIANDVLEITRVCISVLDCVMYSPNDVPKEAAIL